MEQSRNKEDSVTIVKTEEVIEKIDQIETIEEEEEEEEEIEEVIEILEMVAQDILIEERREVVTVKMAEMVAVLKRKEEEEEKETEMKIDYQKTQQKLKKFLTNNLQISRRSKESI